MILLTALFFEPVLRDIFADGSIFRTRPDMIRLKIFKKIFNKFWVHRPRIKHRF